MTENTENRQPVLEVKHLQKSFGTHQVLKDIDFSIYPGDVTSIIGASGSGKSTLWKHPPAVKFCIMVLTFWIRKTMSPNIAPRLAWYFRALIFLII